MRSSTSSQKSWIIVAALGIVFVLATNVIYVRLALQTPPGHSYTGMGLEAVADKLVYYAMIEQGRSGSILMSNPHTSEPQAGSLFSPHWFLIGQLANAIGTPGAYHASRLVLAIGFVLLLWACIRRVFDAPVTRLIAYGTTLFASGLGWLYYVVRPGIAGLSWLQALRQTPADLYVTELAPFSTFIQSPLFMLSYLLILGIWYVLLQERGGGWLFMLTLLLALIHPYDIAVVGIVAVSYYVITGLNRTIRNRVLAIVAGLVIGAGYHLSALLREQALAGWLSQNLAFSPPALPYLLALGILAPLGLLGIVRVVRTGGDRNRWLVLCAIWSVATLISVYLPLDINRRMSNAWAIPLAIMSAYAISGLFYHLKTYILRAFTGALLVLLLFSGTLYRLAQSLLYQPSITESYAYYLPPQLQDALQSASILFEHQPVIASNEEFISMLFGAYSKAVLYVGHPDQTLRYQLKKQELEWLFGSDVGSHALERKQRFLRDKNIAYLVVYHPSLQEQPSWLDADPLYDSALIRIYPLSK